MTKHELLKLGGTRLESADIGVIVAYFIIVLAFGIWSSLKNRGSVGGYFLAGRSMHFVLVGMSLFASNIGSGHFIGLAGTGAASGIGISVFELSATFILVILGWVFVPVYIAAEVFTMPEYLMKRFGGQRIQVYLAVMALLLSVFTKVAPDLLAGAIFIEQALGWDLYISIFLLLSVAALFTITGGLTAVIWTDFIQVIIMILGASYLMIISFVQVGGYDAIVHKFFRAIPKSTLNATVWNTELHENYSYKDCGVPPENSFHLFRAASDDVLPWTGITFGLAISSIWYWCSDQVIVQRTLAAKDLSHAKGGTVLAGYLKLLPLWLIVIPGMISRILFPDEVGCADPDICEEVCSQRTGCTNVAYPYLVLELMPVGARGLMMAVMIAALMSSLTSIFNSSSTIFTMDIWTRIRPKASDPELMIIGRLFVVFMVVIGVAWIPIVQNFAELFHYIQSVTSYLAPPVCAIYTLAISWDRINEPGAFWSLMIGLAVGMVRFIWEATYPPTACGEGLAKHFLIAKVHYLHFGCILFFIVFVAAIVISLNTPPIDPKHLVRLTYKTRLSHEERIDLVPPPPQDDSPPLEFDDEGSPWFKRAIAWLCGIERQKVKVKLTPEEQEAIKRKQRSLEEDPVIRRLCSVNAILLMTVTVFIWGFFY